MTRARFAGPGRTQLVFVLLAALAAVAYVARPAAAQGTRPAGAPAPATARAPMTAAPATAPTTTTADGAAAAAEGEAPGDESYTMIAPAPQSSAAEREFWINYVALPVVAMLAVIAFGALLLFRMRGKRRPDTSTPSSTPPPPAA